MILILDVIWIGGINFTIADSPCSLSSRAAGIACLWNNPGIDSAAAYSLHSPTLMAGIFFVYKMILNRFHICRNRSLLMMSQAINQSNGWRFWIKWQHLKMPQFTTENNNKKVLLWCRINKLRNQFHHLCGRIGGINSGIVSCPVLPQGDHHKGLSITYQDRVILVSQRA